MHRSRETVDACCRDGRGRRAALGYDKEAMIRGESERRSDYRDVDLRVVCLIVAGSRDIDCEVLAGSGQS